MCFVWLWPLGSLVQDKTLAGMRMDNSAAYKNLATNPDVWSRRFVHCCYQLIGEHVLAALMMFTISELGGPIYIHVFVQEFGYVVG